MIGRCDELDFVSHMALAGIGLGHGFSMALCEF